MYMNAGLNITHIYSDTRPIVQLLLYIVESGLAVTINNQLKQKFSVFCGVVKALA